MFFDEPQNEKQEMIKVLPNDFGQIDLNFKVIVIGDSGVGKSCLTVQGIKKYMPEDMRATVGFESFNFVVKMDQTVIRLQIWDTCGQEIYRSLVSNFFKQASCALMVYSINSMASFKNLNYWLKDIKNQSNPNVKIILIGNKCDLEDQRQVSTVDGKKFSDDMLFNSFYETSAKTGKNAEEVFLEAARLLYNDYLSYKQPKENLIKPIVAPPTANTITTQLQKPSRGDKIVVSKGCC